MTDTSTPTPAGPSSAPANNPMSTTELHDLLGDGPSPSWWQRKSVWATAVLLVLGAAGLVAWNRHSGDQAAPVYVTTAASLGNLTLSVSANGTLQPTRSVNIGSELSGTVQRVLVDVNDQVRKGQVMVELDTAKLADQVAKSRAAVNSAVARVAQAVVTVKETQANLARLEEVARLSGGKVPAQAELDTARAALERAQADETSARADVVAAQAAASTDATNLSKGSIRAPMDGVVLTRTVDPGNAVAASLQAVTLFTVAEDLKRLKLQVNVDEADVGAVKMGQTASFTVSAYPSRKYPATLTRVAFGSTTTDNVVTYVTYLDVDNQDLSLRPGMTATSTITATERHQVLLVPNTALRFTPATTAPRADASGGGIVSSLMPRMPGGNARKSAGSSAGAKQVWVLEGNMPVAKTVTTGISDGRMTEVLSGDLQSGMAVITDQRTAGAAP